MIDIYSVLCTGIDVQGYGYSTAFKGVLSSCQVWRDLAAISNTVFL